MSNDKKTMVNSSSNSAEKGRTVEITRDTMNGTDNSPIDSYYNFPSSKVTQEETYSTRISALSEKLGNKDSVKG